MCMILEDWLQDRSAVTYGQFTVTGTTSKVTGPDPMRFCFVIGPTSGANFSIAFNEQDQGGGAFALAAVQEQFVFLRRQIGDVITRPVILYGPANGNTIRWMSVAYDPQRKAVYDDAVRIYFSKLGTP